ncbi:MAG: aspartate carbamoyltransferase catalytic subunit [Sulfurovum sp.]|nr:aspartate carbamoyltransferase catalytic subunit [Sulfurovaceae bacterium]
MQHLIDTTNLTLRQIDNVLTDAKEFKAHKPIALLRDKLLITLFFENSTRTRSSFEVATKRLGASMIHLDLNKSSTNKGETLKDTFLNLCAMQPDGVVIRHSENKIPQELADMNLASVINAGAGNDSHPTQALLDLFTMQDYFGNVKDKTIAIVGDIISSRVAGSNIRLLKRMGMNIILVAPEDFMPESDLEQVEKLENIIDRVDVILSLRAQLERHKRPIFKNYQLYADRYCITKELLGDRDILILHPGPVMRNIDISDEVLEDSRCKVLEQVTNGVYIRMAILKLLFLDS